MKFFKVSLIFLPLALAVTWVASQPPPWREPPPGGQFGPPGGPGGQFGPPGMMGRGPRAVKERPAELKVDLKEPQQGLVKNPRFTAAQPDGKAPLGYMLKGDATWGPCGKADEYTDMGVTFDSGKGTTAKAASANETGDAPRAGSVTQRVTGFEGGVGKWFRFTVRGLAEPNFQVANDGLFLRVDYFGSHGANPLDGVTQNLWPHVEQDRKELAANGKYGKNGGAVWKTYLLEFRLPFAEIDTIDLTAGFKNATAEAAKRTQFYLTDFSLVLIPEPADVPKLVKKASGPMPDVKSLLVLGGRWYYRPEDPTTKSTAKTPDTLIVNAKNADRLYYLDNRLSNPFAENMTAWLHKGNLDLKGKAVTKEQFVPDNVVLEFKGGKELVVHSRNLPNHPTAHFPDPYGTYGNYNPNSIQEIDRTYYLPLTPARNPKAIAMDKTNSNHALPMGFIGVAINGVSFFNPFDAGGMEAIDLMDRCCGHPGPGNDYHYHKYPVCVKTPFVDDGQDHSPLIGFALDGFPIYGPYESKGLMAKDSKLAPLDAFNMHYDEQRGWHYHVTPAKYPYIIGGFAGAVDQRNLHRGPPRG